MKGIHQGAALRTGSSEILELTASNSACPVCGATEKRRVKYAFAPFDIAECAVCDSLHLTPMPTPELLSRIYNSNYYHDAELEHGYLDYKAQAAKIARTYRRRLRFVKPFLENEVNPTVLELGSALGFGLQVAREVLGGHVLACDVSEEAVAASEKVGFKAHLADAYGTCDAIQSRSLDMVFAFDVIEHLPDIRRFSAWLRRVLKPGGIFFVTTPDMDHVLNRILGARSPSIKIPQHVTYFTTITLKNAFSQGFTLKAQEWDFQYVGLGMLLSRLAHIARLPALKHEFGPTLIVPNGMRMYVFSFEGAGADS